MQAFTQRNRRNGEILQLLALREVKHALGAISMRMVDNGGPRDTKVEHRSSGEIV